MMKCQVCNEKEATYFYEETVNGKSRSFHLCRDCAQRLQAEGKLSLKLAEIEWMKEHTGTSPLLLLD